MDEPDRDDIMVLPGNINVWGNNVMPTAFAGCFSAPFSTIVPSLRECGCTTFFQTVYSFHIAPQPN
jgi:hypothetical protein